MKNIFFFLISFQFISGVCLSQSFVTLSFDEINDSIIKREISSFTIASSMKKKSSSSERIELIEITARSCNDTLVYFERGNWIAMNLRVYLTTSSFDTTGHVLTYDQGKLKLIDNKPFWGTAGTIPKTKIKIYQVSFAEHMPNRIPADAFNDLYEPVTCLLTSTKKSKPLTNCRVFESSDKQRKYIYMLNGEGKGAYEVTWVLHHNQLMRIIDTIK